MIQEELVSMPRLIRFLIVSLMLPPMAHHPVLAADSGASECVGVEILDVESSSALSLAGIRAGDIVSGWQQSASDTTDGQINAGSFRTGFDWEWVKFEFAPRGPLTLNIFRDHRQFNVYVPMGHWSEEIFPCELGQFRGHYMKGREMIAGGFIEKGAGTWLDIIVQLEKSHEADRGWLSVQAANVLNRYGAEEWAQQIFRENFEAATDLTTRIEVLQASGKAYEYVHLYDSAVETYKEARKLEAARCDDCLHLARADLRIATALILQSKHHLAVPKLESAWKIYKRIAPVSISAAHCLNNLGTTQRSLGIYKPAIKNLLAALDIRNQLIPESSQTENTLRNIGVLYFEIGDYDRSLIYYQDALKLAQKLPGEKLAVASNLMNIGIIYKNRGDLAAAEQIYRKALRIRGQEPRRDPALSNLYTNIANILNMRHDFDLAYRYYSRALEIDLTISKDGMSTASDYFNIGNLETRRGRRMKAMEYFRKALSILEIINPDHIEIAHIYTNMGTNSLQREDLVAAKDYYKTAIEIIEKTNPEAREIENALIGLGQVLAREGHHRMAENLYRRAIDLKDRHSLSTSSKAEGLRSLAHLYAETDRMELAVEYYEKSMNAADEQIKRIGGTRRSLGQYIYSTSMLYHEIIINLIKAGYSERAFHALERMKANGFVSILAQRDILFSKDIPENESRQLRFLERQYDRKIVEIERASQNSDTDSARRLQVDLQEIYLERSALYKSVIEKSPRLGSAIHPDPVTVDNVKDLLDDKTLAISYSVQADNLVIFGISGSGRYESTVINQGRDKIRNAVEDTLAILKDLRSVSSLSVRRSEDLNRATAKLYELLIRPMDHLIEDSEHLLIVPDGPLHQLPFAILSNRGTDVEFRQRYLTERLYLSFASSLTHYAATVRLSSGVASGHPEGGRKIALFGAPLYEEDLSQADESVISIEMRSITDQGLFHWRPLPYSRLEVESIAEIFDDLSVDLYTGRDATEKNFLDAAPDTHILHLATHGFYDDKLPLNSAIVLSTANAKSTDSQNGLLQVWEIFDKVRMNADLVTISSCQSRPWR